MGRRPPTGVRIPVLPLDVDCADPPIRHPSDPPWRPAGGQGHPSGYGMYDHHGEPLPSDTTEQLLAAVEAVGRHHRVGKTTVFERGAQVTVSTVFLGTDLGGGWADPGPEHRPPLLWETRVYLGRAGGVPLSGCWRYGSAAAARYGHAIIVAALRAGFRDRRPLRGRAPRPGRRPWAGWRRRKGWSR